VDSWGAPEVGGIISRDNLHQLEVTLPGCIVKEVPDSPSAVKNIAESQESSDDLMVARVDDDVRDVRGDCLQ
jgi:hypothetical protein